MANMRALLLFAAVLSCASGQPAPARDAPQPRSAEQAPAPQAPPQLETRTGPGLYTGPSQTPIELVESWPLETTLDHPDIRDAKDVWAELIGGAKTSIDMAQFYASNKAGHPLDGIVRQIEAAAARGVKLRWLAEQVFVKTYPETLDRLEKAPNAQVQRWNVKKVMGGILHAKYFLVDGEQAFIGSQNFDWRALDQIQELGVRLREPRLVAAVKDVFDLDWATATGAQRPAPKVRAADFPVKTDLGDVTFVASPKGHLPDEALWDLPRLQQLIDAAQKTVRVQVLTYKWKASEGPDLEAALKRAAARGVKVELLVADWSKRKSIIGAIKALHAPPGLTVKMMTIPPWSGGHVPYGRVVHAKYLVVDGARAWVGTSNWEPSYFLKSRNLGVIVEGGAIPGRLDKFFADNWDGRYVETVDPNKEYVPPNRGEE